MLVRCMRYYDDDDDDDDDDDAATKIWNDGIDEAMQ